MTGHSPKELELVDLAGPHASTHDLALKSIIEAQLKSHCESRGLDVNRIEIKLENDRVVLEMKDGSDLEKYLQMKPRNDKKAWPEETVIPPNHREPRQNRAERRANKMKNRR